MNKPDILQSFTFEHASIKGEIAHMSKAYLTIMNQRPYPPGVKKLLGEALISCILLTSSIKFEGDFSLQFQGDDRLPLLLVQCDHQLNVRACANYKNGKKIDYEQAFLDGQMSFTINQLHKNDVYQSIVPILSMSMADNIMHYFAQSEQISTKVWLAMSDSAAAGMLLQLLPGQDATQREEFWEYAVQIGQTITENELLTLDNPTILHRLYHETVIRLYDARPVHFKCRCNQTKMQQVLKVLGEEDIKQLLEKKGYVEVSCDFCNQSYRFDSIDIALLFR